MCPGQHSSSPLEFLHLIHDGPRRHEIWPSDMRRVYDSAFRQPRIRFRNRLTRGRRYYAMTRYPNALRRHKCWTVRAELDGQLIGYAWGYMPDEDTPEVYIDDVAVHESYQSCGVGSAVVEEFVAWLRSEGVHRFTCVPMNSRMARILTRHGITSS